MRHLTVPVIDTE